MENFITGVTLTFTGVKTLRQRRVEGGWQTVPGNAITPMLFGASAVFQRIASALKKNYYLEEE